MNFFTKKTSTCLRGKYYSYEGRNIQHYPIIELTPEEQKPFIKLSKYMLELNAKLKTTNAPAEKQLIQQEIIATDKKINEMVYELYNLNEEEIENIEGFLNLFN